MLKNIIFALLALAALATSPLILASDTADAETDLVKALTGGNPAENNAKQETAPPVKVPEAANEAEMQALQANPVLETTDQAPNITPNNDNLFDYRYCLDLKTDLEIAKCRYKKAD